MLKLLLYTGHLFSDLDELIQLKFHLIWFDNFDTSSNARPRSVVGSWSSCSFAIGLSLEYSSIIGFLTVSVSIIFFLPFIHCLIRNFHLILIWTWISTSLSSFIWVLSMCLPVIQRSQINNYPHEELLPLMVNLSLEGSIASSSHIWRSGSKQIRGLRFPDFRSGTGKA